MGATSVQPRSPQLAPALPLAISLKINGRRGRTGDQRTPGGPSRLVGGRAPRFEHRQSCASVGRTIRDLDDGLTGHKPLIHLFEFFRGFISSASICSRPGRIKFNSCPEEAMRQSISRRQDLSEIHQQAVPD